MALFNINERQARILLDALENYQCDNESLTNGWTIVSRDDTETLADVFTLWGEVEDLKDQLKAKFYD